MQKMREKDQYVYRFRQHVDIDDVQDTLTLAVLGAEKLHGRARVRLDGWWHLDRQRRRCVIDASTSVGENIAQLFTGYLSREFGDGTYSVRRTQAPVVAGAHNDP